MNDLKEQIRQLEFEAQSAQKLGDYNKVAELTYGKIPELKSRLEEMEARESEKQ